MGAAKRTKRWRTRYVRQLVRVADERTAFPSIVCISAIHCTAYCSSRGKFPPSPRLPPRGRSPVSGLPGSGTSSSSGPEQRGIIRTSAHSCHLQRGAHRSAARPQSSPVRLPWPPLLARSPSPAKKSRPLELTHSLHTSSTPVVFLPATLPFHYVLAAQACLSWSSPISLINEPASQPNLKTSPH